MVVADVEEDVRRRHAERRRDGVPQGIGLAHGQQPEVRGDQRELRIAVRKHQRRRRQIALDRLDRVAEEPDATLPGAERGVDRAPGSAGEQGGLRFLGGIHRRT